MRNFFLRGKLRKSSDTRSSTSLGSESSESSSRGGSLSPTAGISVVVSDLSNSPSESSNLTADNSPEHTTHPSPNLMTHKRAFSDEANQVTTAPPQPRAVESLKAQSGALSQSSLCINGSHVYTAEPLAPGSAATLPATLGLLQKCSPLSRSLQNLTRRSDDPQRAVPGMEGRRWSFDKAGKEEKAAIAAALEKEGRPVQATAPIIPTVTVAEPPSEGKKPKRNLFSHGRSDSAGKGSDQTKTEQGQAPPPAEETPKGWFGSKDSHNKPSPHPVKPLTNAAPQEDKKSEGRSVLVSGLEKLKSTIHPGRAAQQGEPEADKNKALSEGAAPYYHLTHNELVSLLLQREAELEKQKAEFEKQGALLEKREAEVKKSKVLIRDLEDYIDTLLVRIMEQTPTLLQVRSKLK
ncbi:hypothetical protein AGOR_G00189670 [Albula goreensis]|uniref:FIP-RBD domain-containing protein n=1 Tax=Albula goreensis TaxID=1534307 RepID=A0A8T3CUI5_9TELE|nr:hypothetical protein AGOR_G00189670 [Albula goreensis]